MKPPPTTLNINTLPHVPGATSMTEWTTFGRSRERFIVIAYDEYRQHKRKFRVTVYGHDRSFGHLYHACESFHLTFDAATKAAQKYAVQFAT